MVNKEKDKIVQELKEKAEGLLADIVTFSKKLSYDLEKSKGGATKNNSEVQHE